MRSALVFLWISLLGFLPAFADVNCPSNLNGTYLWQGPPAAHFQQSLRVTIELRNDCAEFFTQWIINDIVALNRTLIPGKINTEEDIDRGQLIGHMYSTAALGNNEIMETFIRTYYEENKNNNSFTMITRYRLNGDGDLVIENTHFMPRDPKKVYETGHTLKRVP